tara:strand:+ start:1400 stop:1726 length:327 start_codon:yes stop_codon:yes gene_type:complete
MNLLVHAGLSEPPTESLPFRYVLCCAKFECDMSILLECEEEMKDMYWKFMRERGMFDFISDIIDPLREEGLSLDVKVRSRRETIITNFIKFDNQERLIEQIENKTIIQ